MFVDKFYTLCRVVADYSIMSPPGLGLGWDNGPIVDMRSHGMPWTLVGDTGQLCYFRGTQVWKIQSLEIYNFKKSKIVKFRIVHYFMLSAKASVF